MTWRTLARPSHVSQTNLPSASSSNVFVAPAGTRRSPPVQPVFTSGTVSRHDVSFTATGSASTSRAGRAASIWAFVTAGLGDRDIMGERPVGGLNDDQPIARLVVHDAREQHRRAPPHPRETAA